MDNQDLRSAAETVFAYARGWKISPRTASLAEIASGRRNAHRQEYVSDQLGGMYDHATEYEFVGGRRPAGIIVHPYRHFTASEVQQIAQRYGLQGAIINPTMYPNPSAQTIVFWRG
jgi:hypothetical protein